MITVTDNRAEHRFEAYDDGALAGFVRYVRRGEYVELVHTEVDPAFEGRGVGSSLAREGLTAARSDGLPVRATCPFVAGWLTRHPEFADLAYHPADAETR